MEYGTDRTIISESFKGVCINLHRCIGISAVTVFHTVPDDLMALDITGQCVNMTTAQNITFPEQGGPLTSWSTLCRNGSNSSSTSGAVRFNGNWTSHWVLIALGSVAAVMAGI
jgi:hypothetical protein